MLSVLTRATPVQPTRSAPLVRLLAHTQSLGLEPSLDRCKCGLSTLVLSLVWQVLGVVPKHHPCFLASFRSNLWGAPRGIRTPDTWFRRRKCCSVQPFLAG
jgi:hypothetical protein